jgi:hypothetical protein
LAEAQASVDFGLVPPCGRDSLLTVTGVHTDLMPGDSAQPRVTFIVSRGDDIAFTLSETRARMPFTAIPQGTRRLVVDREDVLAEGFTGPSGSGSEISYLRWRTGEVTFELSATLRHWQTLADVQFVAAAIIERAVRAGPR